MGYGLAIAGLASAAGGYLASQSKNGQAQNAAAAYQGVSLPDYEKLLKAQLGMAPDAAAMEQQLREIYAPQQMQVATDLYRQFSPQFGKINLRTLGKVDPASVAGREQLYENVSGDLAHKYELDPQFTAQLENGIRAAQSARGNFFGNAPANAESLYKGDAAMRVYQNRLDNMLRFLSAPTPESHFGELAGAGGTSIAGGTAGAVTPGYTYTAPFINEAQHQFDSALGLDVTKAGAAAGAAANTVNPWLAALSSGLGTVGSYAAGGGFSGLGKGTGGGGFTSAALASSAAPYNAGISYTPGMGYVPKAGAI
jgi:hypothetical protein